VGGLSSFNPLAGESFGKVVKIESDHEIWEYCFNPLAGESFGKAPDVDGAPGNRQAVSIPLRGSRLGKISLAMYNCCGVVFQSPCGGVVWERL